MGKVKNLFTSGKMNKDLDERLVPKGEYRDALNVKIANSDGSDVGAIENALSNSKISNISFGSGAKCIGVVEDDASGRIYWAVSSSVGSYICEFVKETNTSTILLSDIRNSSSNILKFNEVRSLSMSILNDAENNKRFLITTDNKTEPKYFEIETARSLLDSAFLLEDVSLIKMSPLTAPAITLEETDDSEENNIEDKFFSFSYRYIYEHGEVSALAPFSDFAFMPKSFRYDYNSGTNKSMFNRYNKVNLSFNTGTNKVKKIEIIAKESGVSTAYIVERLDKSDKEWTDNSDQTFTFSNSKIYKALPSNQLLRLYDNVPIRANTVEIIGGRVVFGNYTENYNLTNNFEDVNTSISTTYESASGTEGVGHETVKSNMDYEVAIAYLDGKGRMTTPITSENNTVHIPINKCNKKNSLSVQISSKAPDWATNYRFFVKQSRNDYDVISPVVFYRDGVYAYIKIEGEDVNKVKEGDFLFLKSDTSGIKSKPTKVKVLEAKPKTRNFLDEDVTDNTLQEPGNYIKLDTEEIALDETSVDTFNYDGYAFRSPSNPNNFQNNISYVESPVFYGEGINDINLASSSYSGTTDKRFEVKVASVGSTDTYKWRSLDCAENKVTSWSSPIAMSGTSSLGEGIAISFSSFTGHTLDDRWIISAKSSTRASTWNGGGSVDDYGRKAIMNFKAKTSSTEGIKAGAIITIEYDDTRSENGVDNLTGYIYQRFVSSADYANLEEWFWEDNVLSKVSHPKDSGEILFRRGTVSSNQETLTIASSGDLWMCILSECNYTGDNRVRIDIDLRVLELDNPIILETDYKNASSDVFYELPYTYNISGGYHQGKIGDTNQTSGGVNATIKLDFFNSFGWYNGYESIKIGDSFNESKMLLDSKPLVPLDNYKQVTRISSLTYSQVYEATTSFNGVNEFNLSLANYKDLDANFGPIARIISRDGDLVSFQSNRVAKVLFNKSVLYNADGSGNLSQNTNVLGQEVPYQGQYGVTDNMYSVVNWSDAMYFADEKRSKVLRLSSNGLFPISDYGMNSWFNDNLHVNSNVVAGYDPVNQQYVLRVWDKVIQWREGTKKCESFEWLEDTYSCQAQATTTTTTQATTTTTTQATTTTTTQPLDCDSYYNNSGQVLTGIDYYDCSGILIENVTVGLGEDICASQEPFGGDAGFLIFNGPCGSPPTTTTTTTAAPTTTTSTTTTTTCTPNGTLLSTYCVGQDLWGTYADGSCGTYNQLIEENSPSCITTTTTTTETPCVQRIAYSGIPTQSIEVGENKTINLDNFFTQLDGQPLSYLAINTTGYLDSVSVSGNQLTMFANSGNLCGTDGAGVYVQAYDSINGNCEYGTYFGIEVFGCIVETTTTTLPTTTTTSTSTTTSTTTTLFESYPYKISAQGGIDTVCYSELIETVYTDVPTLGGITNGTILYTDIAKTTVKNGGFYRFALGNTTDTYGSLQCSISYSGVVGNLSSCTTTTVAPTNPTGTIVVTGVDQNSRILGYNMYQTDASDVFSEITITTSTETVTVRQDEFETIPNQTFGSSFGWDTHINAMDGATGSISLILVNNLGQETVADTDTFFIPSMAPDPQILGVGAWAPVPINNTKFGFIRDGEFKGSLTDQWWRLDGTWKIRLIQYDTDNNDFRIRLRKDGSNPEPVTFNGITFDWTPFQGTIPPPVRFAYADLVDKIIVVEGQYTYITYVWSYGTDFITSGNAEITFD